MEDLFLLVEVFKCVFPNTRQSVITCHIRTNYEANYDFKMAILHLIDGFATRPNTENIFSCNVVNIMQYCRLKIAISFVSRVNCCSGKLRKQN